MPPKSDGRGASDLDEDPSKDLAAWLKDVGRRKWQPSQLSAMGDSAGGTASSEDVIRYLEELSGGKIRSREDVRRCFGELWASDCGAGQIYRRRQIVKEALLLLCLVASYIQYYYWDVNLQIARLPSTVIFVPAETNQRAPHKAVRVASVSPALIERTPASGR